MKKEEAIERLKQNKAAAEFYAQRIGNYRSAENEVKDIEAFNMAIEALSERTGEWILECDSEGEGDNLYRCSKCGCKYGCQEYDKPNFCPNCGAKMKGADDE